MKRTRVSYNPASGLQTYQAGWKRLSYSVFERRWEPVERDWFYLLRPFINAWRRGFWSLAKRLEGR